MADSPTLSRGRLAFALAVICFANFLNYLDRQVVSALESEIRPAFELSKEEFGLLWSAFTVGYMVFAPLVGHAAVRGRRTLIFAVCVLVWSLATIGSGLADSKLQLYASRFLIGVGEAGCLVIGPTLVVDLFSARVRGRALSIFYLGLPLGGTAGYLVGGVVTEHFGGWRNAFLVAGAPGLLVALLILFLPEPRRAPAPTGTQETGLAPYLALLRNRTLMLIILAQAFAVMILVPLLHFGIAFFESERGMTKLQATSYLGVIGLVAGVLGSVLAGILGDRLARRTRGAYALLAGCAYALALPALLVGFTAREPAVILVSLTIGATCLFLCMPAVNTQIANVVRPDQRAMAYALAVFILHFLGDMAAPPAFGAMATYLQSTGDTFVRFVGVLVLAATCCFVAARTAARDVAAAER
jgi:MFS transporter, Spinster family, sphingosine-1-phosphate transporter